MLVMKQINVSQVTYPDEDDRRSLGHKTVEFEQGGVLVRVLVNVDVELLDAFNGKFFMCERKDVGVGGEAVSVIDDVLWESCREQNSHDALGKESTQVSTNAWVYQGPLTL